MAKKILIADNEYIGLVFRNEGQKTVEIDVEGVIGGSFWGEDTDTSKNTKEKMKAELKRLSTLKAEIIIVNINSYGGDVNHGLSIHDLLSENSAKIITKINGMTASAATIIAMAGDERKISDNSLFLAHRASTIVMGNLNDINMVADDLKKVDDRIINLYTKVTGKSQDEITEVMNRNNGNGEWITPEEAKRIGFVTDIFEPTKMAAIYSDDILSKFHLPEVPNGYMICAEQDETEPGWVQKIVSAIGQLIPSQQTLITNSKNMNKDFKFINQAINIDGLESGDGKTFILSLEMIQAINAKLEADEKAGNEAKTAIETAQNEAKTAKEKLNQAINLVDGIHDDVKAADTVENKIAAVTAIIAKKPGQGAAQNLGDDDHDHGDVNQETIDNLPHNREADANLY